MIGVCTHPGSVTVLTDPTPMFNPHGAWRNVNRALPGRLHKWIARLAGSPPGGHRAVTRSLLDGLRALDVHSNYNPASERCIARHCVVLSNADALRQAILLKRQGRIERLLAGPNLFTVPTEMDGLLGSAEIDICLVPSQWVKELYVALLPALDGRIEVWPAGVDIAQWNVLRKAENRGPLKVLLYVKNGMSLGLLEEVHGSLTQRGAAVSRIDYGSYDAAGFRRALETTDICVFISASESQGIALQEAWSCDRPTWVFNPGVWTDAQGHPYPASSAPYLTPSCGDSFTDIAELENLMDRWNNGDATYQPRAWVEQHMTDAACTSNLLNIIFNPKGRL